MSSTESCVGRWNDEVNRFQTLFFVSLGLTLANVVVTFLLIAKMQWSARKLALYHFGTGAVKVFLAISIFAIIPQCPYGCTCVGSYVHPIVAVFPLLIGLRWLARGYQYWQKQNETADTETMPPTTNKDSVDSEIV